jgi:hypothetical protein
MEPAERLIALAEREVCQLAVLAGAGPCPVVIVPSPAVTC